MFRPSGRTIKEQLGTEEERRLAAQQAVVDELNRSIEQRKKQAEAHGITADDIAEATHTKDGPLTIEKLQNFPHDPHLPGYVKSSPELILEKARPDFAEVPTPANATRWRGGVHAIGVEDAVKAGIATESEGSRQLQNKAGAAGALPHGSSSGGRLEKDNDTVIIDATVEEPQTKSNGPNDNKK